MKVVIIENPGQTSLTTVLRATEGSIEILACIRNTREAVQYFRNRPQPDLLFLQTDTVTLSLERFFTAFSLCCPVVFVGCRSTAGKEIMPGNCIALLDDPPSVGDLAACLRHYRAMQDFFMNRHSPLFGFFREDQRIRSRILIRKGADYEFIRTCDIVYFSSRRKLVFLGDRNEEKYLSTAKSLSELEQQLDPDLFYRANRKFIVNVGFIEGFTRIPDGRFMLRLNRKTEEPIWISQPNTAAFSHWMGEKL